MIFFNGDIITMKGEKEKAGALVVENGKITEVGNTELLQKLAGSDNQTMTDLKGAALMPSFIDAHSHFSSVATSFLELSVEKAKSIDDMLEMIRDFIKRENKPKGSWITAKGYDQNFLKEKRHPTALELDKVSPENPVVLYHRSEHMGVFNTAAIELLDITPPKKDKNSFTGYLEEGEFLRYTEKVPMASLEDMETAYEKAQEKYASYGITTVQEGMTVDRLIPFYQMLKNTSALYLDLVCFCGIDSGKKFLAEFKNHIGKYESRIKIGGYKIFLDGSPQGRTAWMRKPYLGGGNHFGHSSMKDSDVYDSLRISAENNMQLLSHCNGDRAVQQLLEAAEKAEKDGCKLKDTRPVIVHGQFMGTDQLKKAKDLGFIASFFPAHIFYWGDIHVENFGKDRAENISPAGSAEKEGLIYTFHQDSPVTEPDMLKTVWCAAARKTESGELLGKSQRISVFNALKAVTASAAYQYFEESEKGTIEKGKKADLVILSKNPLECSIDELPDIKILSTFKEGKKIWEAT